MNIKVIRKFLILTVFFASTIIFLSLDKVYASTYQPPEDRQLISYTESRLAPGIFEKEIVTNSVDGKSQVTGYSIEIDMSLPTTGIMSGYKDHSGSTWGMQTVRTQAEKAEQKTGRNVIAAVNADFYNMATGQPYGALVMNGITYQASNNRPFFAVLKDGTAVIGEGKDYDQYKDEINESVGGNIIMVKNGKIIEASDDYFTGLHPRTTVGIKADGSVIIYVADGRNYPKSVGINLYDLAKMMVSLGAVTALNLDGGGSTTYLSQYEGTNSLQLRNVPSDGIERTVSSSLLVYSSALYDGNFTHASIMPNNVIYTPNSEVKLDVIGVDSAGGPAVLPNNLVWSVDSSYGTVSQSGVFKSNGTEGEVKIKILQNNVEVGTTVIHIRKPDQLSFDREELSLGFEKESDLGLSAYYQGKPIQTKDDDFIFTYDESMGTFNGKIFTSSDHATITSEIVARYKDSDVEATLILTVGQLPVVVFDFENEEEVYESWEIETAGRNEKGDLEVVDYDSGEPVRFGDKSLKINFDFTEGQKGTTLGVYAGVGEKYDIPGSPTAIGMWVYATPESQGYWLRMRVLDGSGAIQQVDFTEEGVGINWLGWKYVEGSLEKYTGPFKTLDAQMIRIMMLRSGQPNSMGQMISGSIYIDDIRVVYGANLDDLYAPIITSIKVNDQEVNGQTLTSDTITIETNFDDNWTDKYASGIDYDKVNIYIDGVNYRTNTDYFGLDQGGNRAFLYNLNLSNGYHEVKVVIRDNFGNETEVKKYFNIENGIKDKVTLVPSLEKPLIGNEYILTLESDLIHDVEEVEFVLQTTTVPDEVTFQQGFEGTYTYNSVLRTLTVHASKTGETLENSKSILKIRYSISNTVLEGTKLSYQINRGLIKYTNSETTFSDLPRTYEINSSLFISSELSIIDSETVIEVRDLSNKLVENAEVFLLSESFEVIKTLGTTDVDGRLVTDELSFSLGKHIIYAKKNNELSFRHNVITINAYGPTDNTPVNISYNASKNGSYSKNISWLTNPLTDTLNPIVQYALKSDYIKNGESAFNENIGKSFIHAFTAALKNTDNYAVKINYVDIDDLLPGNKYVYRVGNGEVWSDIAEFETIYQNQKTDFLIIGDIQTNNMEELINSLSAIQFKDTYDFILQTGDLIDELSRFYTWHNTIDALTESWIGEVDIVRVLGNHEYMGDIDGTISSNFYNLPQNEKNNSNYYSLEYGSVYIAVINFTHDKNQLIEALEWMVQDSKKSNAIWKIIATHQPVYYTNVSGGNGLFLEHVPKYAEEAGIDFVFSGHDHAYARTKPMINGQIDSNGVIYIISGSIGEKSYSAINTPAYNFDTINDKYEAVYMTVTATQNRFEYRVYEVSGEMIDSFYKEKQIDKSEEKWQVDGERLISSMNGYNIDKNTYTGFAYESDNLVYMILGKKITGWFAVDKDEYYALENGNILIGEQLVDNATIYFDEHGKFIGGETNFVTFENKTKYYLNGKPVKGWYDIDGYSYYFSTWDYFMRTGSTTVGGVSLDFDQEGKLLTTQKFVTTTSGTQLYINGRRYGGWIVIDDNTYYFSKSNHYMRTGKTTIDGISYDFDGEGRLITKLKWESSKNGMQLYENGQLYKGWKFVYDEWYYFSTTSTGYMRTGKTTVSGKSYEFSATGKLIKGSFVVENGATKYYYGPSYVTGWQNIEGLLYYFDENGKMLTGKQSIEGYDVFFTSEGIYFAGLENYTGFIDIPAGISYYENGNKKTGWFEAFGNTYYAREDGYLVTKETEIQNQLYYFTEDGVLVEDGQITNSYGLYYLTKYLDNKTGSYIDFLNEYKFNENQSFNIIRSVLTMETSEGHFIELIDLDMLVQSKVQISYDQEKDILSILMPNKLIINIGTIEEIESHVKLYDGNTLIDYVIMSKDDKLEDPNIDDEYNKFVGWSFDKLGENMYDSAKSIFLDTKLYAQWTRDDVSVEVLGGFAKILGQDTFEYDDHITISLIADYGYEITKIDVVGANFKVSGSQITLSEIEGKFVSIVIETVQQSNLPIINIDTNNQPITNKEDYVDSTFSMSNAGEFNISEKSLGVRLRGNSTLILPKKPYRLKFDKKISLFGSEAFKSWVLLADYYDISHIKNYAAYSLAGRLDGMNFAPMTQHVVVYINGEYQGLYLLTDQIQENQGRVGVEVDFDTSNEVPFLVEMDEYAPSEGVLDVDYFSIGNRHYAIKYPDADQRYNEEQFIYIKDYITTIDTLIKTKGNYRDYIDVNSLIDFYLVNEIMSNKDVVYKSVYMSKEIGMKLTMGPVWDFDWSLGGPIIYFESNMIDEQRGWISGNSWFTLLLNDESFTIDLKERWQEIMPILDDWIYDLEYYQETIENDALIGLQRWDRFTDTDDVLLTFQGQYQYIVTRLTSRIAELDSLIDKF